MTKQPNWKKYKELDHELLPKRGKDIEHDFLFVVAALFVVKNEGDVLAPSKCVWGLRYHEPHGGDETM